MIHPLRIAAQGRVDQFPVGLLDSPGHELPRAEEPLRHRARRRLIRRNKRGSSDALGSGGCGNGHGSLMSILRMDGPAR